ncbi:TIP41-domain-containing protein [Sistotremastrum suecicum HHB10207 ss-3]|uniref:TIP41-domain-containing protein n=1 Tax=Sistotremastrum suecicum HHB10207 ss-3 TaxID=1314776 RepID=A0A166HQN9_9AGAM|nr:TIP41-domain-containing protein [Sistotremastrum suecicum HHB10207 ss-3]
MAIPEYQLSNPSPHVSAISINSWEITSSKKPISNARRLDQLHHVLEIPLPEMTYGDNWLSVKHKASGWEYRLDTQAALSAVRNGELRPGDGGVKVDYADKWLVRSSSAPDSSLPMPETVVTKEYDWTYTTTYSGSVNQPDSFQPAVPENPFHNIPLEELKRRDPILFFSEIPLFEDELHDNGSSNYTVRVRVMPTCLFILARFILRVDNVLFRVHDTRVYHSFKRSPAILVKETCGWEAPYDTLKQRLASGNDLSALTSEAAITEQLTDMDQNQSVIGAGTGWKGLGRTVEVVKLE